MNECTMNVDDRWFSVYALREGFSSPSLGMMFAYLTPDCTGQPYGTGAGGGLVPNARVLSLHAWYADLDAPAVTIAGTPEAPGMFWFQQIGSNGPLGPCSPSTVTGTIVLWPMRSVDVSGFVPPFRLTN
jgi:hypothetical protein